MITPSLTNLFFITAALFGLLICFFGYRIMRFLVAVAGFVIGAGLAATVALSLTQESILALTKGSDFLIIIAAGIAGGLILSIILLFLYPAGVFLLGAVFGILLSSAVIALFNIVLEPVLYVIPALLGGILTLLIQRFMLILMTSAIGAWLSVLGVLYIISSNFNPSDPDFINNLGDIEIYRLILGWIALFGLGIITQYFIFPHHVKVPQVSENDSQTERD